MHFCSSQTQASIYLAVVAVCWLLVTNKQPWSSQYPSPASGGRGFAGADIMLVCCVQVVSVACRLFPGLWLTAAIATVQPGTFIVCQPRVGVSDAC